MRITLTFFFIFLLSACSTSVDQGNSNTIPLRHFFKNSEIKSFRLSPDGKTIAALRPYKDRMNIFVKKLNQEKWTRITGQTDRDIANLFWKGNDHVLFIRDFGGDENFHLFSANIHTKKSRDLTPFKNTRVGVLDDLDGISEKHMLISMNKRNKQIFDVFKINITNGNMVEVARNPGNYTGWLTDHTGTIRMATSTDGVNSTLFYRTNSKSKFKKVITTNFKQKLYPLFFDFNNKNVYAVSNLKSDTQQIILMNPRNGKQLKVLAKNKNYDITGFSYSKKRKEITHSSFTDTKFRMHFFSKYYKDIVKDIESKVPGKEVHLTSHNRDENLFTVYTASDRSKGMYYLYDAKSKKLSFLANPSPWIDENRMAQMKPITFTSRDGLKIEGYLTLPMGKENKKNLPMIVNPHGGPWHRDTWGYNPEVQFLANRGYAVLQINFRGSTGYGRNFWKASFKQWGLTMQNDITDGVNWAVKKGFANKERICIYGASYGGYATLAGLTYTPDLYKCGVDYVGVSNLLSFMKTIPPYWKPYLKMLHEMVGHPVKERDMLVKASPFFNADKIKSPLFVAQGAKDPRVNKNESDQIVSALKKRGIDVPYMVKENEGHGFHNQENRFEFYERMEKFLHKHLKL